MDYLNIFLLGGASGIIFSLISMILIGAKNSEIYPIGGIMPALWLIDELGLASQIIVAGILIIGGMTGFYLTLTFWKERTIISHNNERETKNLDITNEDSSEKVNVKTVNGKSLSEFL